MTFVTPATRVMMMVMVMIMMMVMMMVTVMMTFVTLATPVPALCRQSLRPGKEKYLNTENLRHIKMIL